MGRGFFGRLLVAASLFLPWVAAAAPPPNTDDLLVGLPAEMRAKILVGADAKRICKIRVLEKELGIKFQAGSPTSEPEDVGGEKPCDSEQPTSVASIASADELIEDEGVDQTVDRKARSKWFNAPPAYCRFKAMYSKSLERASVKIDANDGFGITDETDRAANRFCFFGGIAADNWKVNSRQPFCATSQLSSSTALECFYTEECRIGCGPGAVSLQMLGMMEVFAGSDGILSDAERERFEKYYPEVTIGEFQGDDSPNGIEASNSPFEGSELRRGRNFKLVRLSNYASKGRYGITGFRVVVDTKTTYKTAARQTQDHNKWINLSENAVVLSTSLAGAASISESRLEGSTASADVVGEFEADMKILAKAMAGMNFLSSSEGSISDRSLWQPWDQITSPRNQAALAAGTYKFYNIEGDDQRHISAALSILNKPRYRDTKIHVHPLGRMSLAQAAVQILKYHPNAPVTLWTPVSAEHRHYARFVDSRIDACLEKTAAAR